MANTKNYCQRDSYLDRHKVLLFWRTICLAAALICAGMASAESVKIGELYYQLNAATKTAIVSPAPSTDKYAFENMTIPESVEYATEEGSVSYTVSEIASSAFKGCTKLNELVVPGSVLTIGANALQGCTSLTALRLLDSTEPLKFLKDIFGSDITDAKLTEFTLYISRPLISTTSTTRIFNGIPIQNFVIDNIGTISDKYFSSSAYVKRVVIGNGIEKIDNSGFSNCTNLISLEIEDGVETIAKTGSAFDNCKSLQTVKLPATLTYITPLYESSELADIYIYAIEPPTVSRIKDNGVYPDSPSVNCTVHVPAESLEKYKSADGWKNLPAGYTIVGDLGLPTGTNISFEAGDGGALAVVAFDGEAVDFTPVKSGSQTFELEAVNVTVAAIPDAGQEAVSLQFTALDNTEILPTSYRMRGGWLEATLPLQNFTAKASFEPASTRTLTITAPTIAEEEVPGAQLKLALPKGSAYQFEYQPTQGYKVDAMQLGDDHLDFTTSENGAALVEIPDYEGERALRIVEVKDIPTSTSEIKGDHPTLRHAGNVWQLSNVAPGTDITVYNIQGTPVYCIKSTAATCALPAELKGIHLLTAGQATFKVSF